MSTSQHRQVLEGRRALVVGIVMGLAQLAPCATSFYSRDDTTFAGVSDAMPIVGDQQAGFFLVRRGLSRALGLGPAAEPQFVPATGLAFAASMPPRMERSSELSSRNITSGPAAQLVWLTLARAGSQSLSSPNR